MNTINSTPPPLPGNRNYKDRLKNSTNRTGNILPGVIPGKNDFSRPENKYNGVFFLIVLNLVIFFLDHILGLGIMRSLYLNFNDWKIYQLFTNTICHLNWMHISGNIFGLYIFGRIIEEEEGTLVLLLAYLTTGIGGSLLALIFNNAKYGHLVGASGAVFGFFVVGTMVKLKMDWRSILEVLILGQYAIGNIWGEFQLLDKNDGISHLAHLGGGITGALLMLGFIYIMNKTDFGESLQAIRGKYY